MKNLGFYPRLAFDGIRKNSRMYVPYLLTCVLMVCMHYILLALSAEVQLRQIRGAGSLGIILSLGAGVVLVFSLLFLFYTNAFLLRRRKREFGLYSVLGCGKRDLARIITWESLISGAMALAAGLLLGVVLSLLAELGLTRLLGMGAEFTLRVDLYALRETAWRYVVIFAMIWLSAVVRVERASAVSLLKSESAGEKPPRANWVAAVLGIAVLAAAYYLAVSIESPLDAIIWFFVAVILVIVGTYLLMISGSVALCRALQRNKRYYYRPNHFISVSSMAYRMRRNGAGLASICIIATMVLVMISSTSCLYFGAEDSLRTRYPREENLAVFFDDEADMVPTADIFRRAAAETAVQSGAEMQNVQDVRFANITGRLSGDTLACDAAAVDGGFSYGDLRDVYFVPQSDYNALTGESISLAPGETALRTDRCTYSGDTLRFAESGLSLRVADSRSASISLCITDVQVVAAIIAVVPDLADIAAAFEGSSPALSLRWTYGFDTGLPDARQSTLSAAVESRLAQYCEADGVQYIYFRMDARADGSDDFFGSYGGMFFLGIVLSLVFCLAAVLILYYKQLSEGYEDRARFSIMRRVGMTRREIRRSVNSQLLTVFYLPLIFAAVHLAFAFPMIRRLLLLFSLTNVGLFAAATGISFAVFALLYALVYRRTSSAYYAIVSGGEE